MHDYCPNLNELSFDDINKDWIVNFENYLSLTMKSKNARNVHLRNIRAVFNDAIDNDITTCYPFRKVNLRPTPTMKRSLSVVQLRQLFNADVEQYAIIYLDIFKLSFYLIGINMVDLLHLTTDNVINGRIEYIRAKTGRRYSIKIEPECQEIFDRYKGSNYLLSIMDTHKNYKDFIKRMDKALKRIGVINIGKHGKKTIYPYFPHLSTYWARHTWATLASELDIPKDTIAHSLGHGNNTVTDIYINFSEWKIDVANRKVIDFVLYNKV